MIRPYMKFLILAPWLGPLMGLSAKWWLCAASLWYGGFDKLSLMGFLSYLLWGIFSFSSFFYFFFQMGLFLGDACWTGELVGMIGSSDEIAEISGCWREFGIWRLIVAALLRLFFLFSSTRFLFFFVKFLRWSCH